MMIDKLLSLMAEKKASDVFITVGAPIQIKINAQLRPVNTQIVGKDTIDKIVDEILPANEKMILARDRDVNLSLSRSGLGNFRVNVFFQRRSPSLVIRHIPYEIPQVADLNLPSVLLDLVLQKRGLILIVGSTGSGKSTTLAAMIDHRLATHHGHVLTVEDPIEFLFKHNKSIVNQREVGLDTPSWQSALKSAMRQTPDCIMIGEIRDRETMSAAITYAMTGHLCLSSLHANNAYHALSRISSFYPPEARAALQIDLSVALKAIVSQRLCKKSDGSGLIPACEVLVSDTRIAELVQQGDWMGVKETMGKLQSTACKTFEQDLLRLLREGKISQDEAIALADSPADLLWQLNNQEGGTSSPTAVNTRLKAMTVDLDANDAPAGEAAPKVSFQEFDLIQGEP